MPPLDNLAFFLQWLACLSRLTSLGVIGRSGVDPVICPRIREDPGSTAHCSSLQQLSVSMTCMPLRVLGEIVALVADTLTELNVLNFMPLSDDKDSDTDRRTSMKSQI